MCVGIVGVDVLGVLAGDVRSVRLASIGGRGLVLMGVRLDPMLLSRDYNVLTVLLHVYHV